MKNLTFCLAVLFALSACKKLTSTSGETGMRLIAGSATSFTVTPDFFSILASSELTVSTVTGTNTALATTANGMAVDSTNDVIYALTDEGNVNVYSGIATLTGDVAPTRVIDLSDVAAAYGMAYDETRDRMYILVFNGSGNRRLNIYNSWSTKTFSASADVVTAVNSGTLIAVEPTTDRLYTGVSGGAFKSYDNASTIAADAAATRSFNLSTGSCGISSIAVTPTDKLIVGCSGNSTAGNNLAIFSNASTLAATTNYDSESSARYDSTYGVTALAYDAATDSLLASISSLETVAIWTDFAGLTGAMTSPTLQVGAVQPASTSTLLVQNY